MSDVLIALQTISVIVYAVSSMFQAGLGSRLAEVLGPLRNVGATVRALIANFVLVPLLALVLLRLLDPPTSLAIGLFLTAAAAGAPFLIKLAEVAEADVALSVAQLLVLLPVTIIYMPLVIPLALPQAEVSAAAIAKPLVLTLLLPLTVGLLVRVFAPHWAMAMHPLLGKLSSTALIALIVFTVLANLPGILAVFRTSAILAAILLIMGAFGIGFLLGGQTLRRREVLGLATGQRNIAAATVAATQAIGDPNTITMVVVTSMTGLVILFAVAWLLSRSTHETRGASDHRPGGR